MGTNFLVNPRLKQFALFSAIFLVFRHKWTYIFNSDPGMFHPHAHVTCRG